MSAWVWPCKAQIWRALALSLVLAKAGPAAAAVTDSKWPERAEQPSLCASAAEAIYTTDRWALSELVAGEISPEKAQVHEAMAWANVGIFFYKQLTDIFSGPDFKLPSTMEEGDALVVSVFEQLESRCGHLLDVYSSAAKQTVHEILAKKPGEVAAMSYYDMLLNRTSSAAVHASHVPQRAGDTVMLGGYSVIVLLSVYGDYLGA